MRSARDGVHACVMIFCFFFSQGDVKHGWCFPQYEHSLDGEERMEISRKEPERGMKMSGNNFCLFSPVHWQVFFFPRVQIRQVLRLQSLAFSLYKLHRVSGIMTKYCRIPWKHMTGAGTQLVCSTIKKKKSQIYWCQCSWINHIYTTVQLNSWFNSIYRFIDERAWS